MYVNNILIGIDSVEEAYCVFGEANDIFKRAAMNLRQWNLNLGEFLESLPIGERANHGSGIVKVLGMVWDRINDVIQIPGFYYHGGDVSKREVLHCVARVFDPLGLVAPTTLYGKLFLQWLWKLNQP